MSDWIDKIAKAIHDRVSIVQWDELTPFMRGEYREDVRTALRVMREPSDAMIVHGDDGGTGRCTTIWQAMIDEALK